ncbi:hypothetical protein [Desulfuromonas sp. TF]|uniref:hypothetical protein n=1 Tax=Desulfuromonas sp. TF TaxID=1232410 RepID=UPI0004859B4D|nr:hypothetical protein [Desulfuromonas sp. TF]
MTWLARKGMMRVSGSWTPLSLFASGEQGVWYDPSDLSTLFQDAAGTTPAGVGDPVGLMLDKSGNGNHASQETSSKKPILRLSGGLIYLEFDGVDDFLFASSMAASGSAAMFAAIQTTDSLWMLASREDTTAQPWLFICQAGDSGLIFRGAGGSPAAYVNRVVVSPATRGAFHDAVIGVAAKIVTSPSLDLSSLTSMKFSGYSAGYDLGGKLYGLAITEALASEQLGTMEAYLAQKAGVTL